MHAPLRSALASAAFFSSGPSAPRGPLANRMPQPGRRPSRGPRDGSSPPGSARPQASSAGVAGGSAAQPSHASLRGSMASRGPLAPPYPDNAPPPTPGALFQRVPLTAADIADTPAVRQSREAVLDDYAKQGLDLRAPLPPPTAASRSAELDVASLFAKSRLHASFDAPVEGPSFFASMAPKVPIYLGGSRRLVEPNGRTITTHAVFLVRTIDPSILAMVDTLTTFDYAADRPTQQMTTAIVADDGTRAHVVDIDEKLGRVQSRTVVKLRGEPWRWDSAMSMNQINPETLPEHMRPPEDADPEDLTVGSVMVARFRFNPRTMLSERFMLHNGGVIMGIVDELKVITEGEYDQKVRALFEASLPEEDRAQMEFQQHFGENMSPEQIDAKIKELGLMPPPNSGEPGMGGGMGPGAGASGVGAGSVGAGARGKGGYTPRKGGRGGI